MPEPIKSAAKPTPLWLKLIAELFGTFILVFFGILIGEQTIGLQSTDPWGAIMTVCLAWGLTVTLLCYCLGGVSGCHLNPSVTLAMAIEKKLSWGDAFAYFAVQVVGAVLAGICGWAIFGENGGTICSTLVNSAVLAGGEVGSLFVGALLECIGTFALVWFILFITSDPKYSALTGIAIGLILWLAIAVLFNFTGGSLNPARSIGSAVGAALNGNFKPFQEIWVYIVGPLCGGALATVAFNGFDKRKAA